ncbi:MAG TPA: VCBS repeat-containing protein [Armatimonadota bacterium]|nr:VCBS repeat-containing protein [Armatimonadota bacterium]
MNSLQISSLPARLSFVVAIAASGFAPAAFAAPEVVIPATAPSIRFHKITINAASDFECACAADINGDGKLDIVCGDTWYEAPNWTPHKFREFGVWGRGPHESGYRKDFADLPMDVNGDGKIDIVSCDYSSGEIFWDENTGDATPWPRHLIAHPGAMETMNLAPLITGAPPAILPNPGGKVVWYELGKPGPNPDWVEHVVGTQGAGHGIGWGDVNGDGKTDIITPHGWYEQVDAAKDQWIWHPDWECIPHRASIPMLVMDVDGDGRNDIVFGAGHNYGVYWIQQPPPGTPGKWIIHPIDTTWSQAHTMILADLEGNGHPVVVTGKRYLAHDTDPGAHEPLGVFYYTYNRKSGQWIKHVIDEGTHTGTGLQITAIDLRNTGRLDLICPGKSGLYLFEQDGGRRRRARRARP